MARMRYEAPRLVDYGNLTQITEAVHPKLAMSAVSDLSFSSGAQGIQGTTASSPPGTVSGGGQPGLSSHAGHPSTGLAPGAGNGSGGNGLTPAAGSSGGGRTLPFTGFAAGIAAAAGSALLAGGSALRRRLRRR